MLQQLDPFQIPIFCCRDFISNEQCSDLITLCEKQEYSGINQYHVQISENKSILEGDLKKEVEEFIQTISLEVLKQDSEGFEIKASWATKCLQGQHSSMHMHKNYYMSAVLYLQDSELVLENPLWDKSHFHFAPLMKSPFTCDTSTMFFHKNSLLLMPAWIKHTVPPWYGEGIRYSIAMNIHPVGEYGGPTSSIFVK